MSEPGPFADALARHRAGDLDGAIALYRDIIDRTPDHPEAWHLLGLAAHQKGQSALGRTLIETAIGLDAARADYHSNLAQVLRALGDDAAAEASLRRALALDARHGKALANLASVLRAQGRFAEALDAAERAVAAAPDDPETHNNLGNALKDAMRSEDALAAYARAVALAPEFALAHWNMALVLLALGRTAPGFAEMQWRWRWSGFPAKPRRYDAPPWTGAPGGGGTLFLYPEQGLGDTMQFVRYASLARMRGWRVALEAPAPLAPLLRADLADEVVTPGVVPAFDAHAPLGDLPHLFGTTLDTVPAQVPYLRVDPSLAAAMRARTRATGRLRVGLNWTGNPASPVERFRHLPLDQFAALAALAGIDWMCLQRGPGGAALARPPGLSLIESGEGPLAETAALIETLDAVVTTDTAIAHLAGALAKPTLLMLHHAPDWRWLLGRADSPWYPTVRLFRQALPGDWAPVVAAVAEALRARV